MRLMGKHTGTVVMEIHDGASQYQLQSHKIDVVDFVNEAHIQARKHSGFGKYIMVLPKIRHTATK